MGQVRPLEGRVAKKEIVKEGQQGRPAGPEHTITHGCARTTMKSRRPRRRTRASKRRSRQSRRFSRWPSRSSRISTDSAPVGRPKPGSAGAGGARSLQLMNKRVSGAVKESCKSKTPAERTVSGDRRITLGR